MELSGQERIKLLLEKIIEVNYTLIDIENDLGELTPRERLDFLVKLLPYILPKISEVEKKMDNSLFVNVAIVKKK